MPADRRFGCDSSYRLTRRLKAADPAVQVFADEGSVVRRQEPLAPQVGTGRAGRTGRTAGTGCLPSGGVRHAAPLLLTPERLLHERLDLHLCLFL